jgi:hypothetical protein
MHRNFARFLKFILANHYFYFSSLASKRQMRSNGQQKPLFSVAWAQGELHEALDNHFHLQCTEYCG